MDQKAYPKKKIKSQYYTKLYKFHMKIVQKNGHWKLSRLLHFQQKKILKNYPRDTMNIQNLQ